MLLDNWIPTICTMINNNKAMSLVENTYGIQITIAITFFFDQLAIAYG